MARLTNEDFLNKIKLMIGDRTDDEALALLEDATDTLKESGTGDLEAKIKVLEQEKADLDKMWREKYRDRFLNIDTPEAPDKKAPDPGENPGNDNDNHADIQIDDLFSAE